MTLKEWAKKNGADVKDTYQGGVAGCPIDYRFIRNGRKYICRGLDPDEKDCTECWNQEYKETRMTNADRIRTMSDEELAMETMCPYQREDCAATNCYQCSLEWLQQEANYEE